MNTASITHSNFHQLTDMCFNSIKKLNPMKKLTNVSPFLLLLVPVFIMMILTFSASTNSETQDEIAMKASSSKSVIKGVTTLVK